MVKNAYTMMCLNCTLLNDFYTHIKISNQIYNTFTNNMHTIKVLTTVLL